jgi:predicted acyltransferase
MAEAKAAVAVPGRIASIDVLRGFDMFWITGGEGLIHALLHIFPDSPVIQGLDKQFHHVPWEGFVFYDLIFPLFIFIVGVVLPFSLTKRLESGANRWQLYEHIAKRLIILFMLGLLYNGLLDFNFHTLRLAGVLQRIGLAYFFAAIIVMNFKTRGQAIATGSLLVAYFLILKFVPVPGVGAGVLTPTGNLGAYLDQTFLPHPYCCYTYGDNEGILSTIGAICTCMMGVLAGHWLRSERTPNRKFIGLVIAGVASLAVALAWGIWLPIIKNLWTSSYVLFAAGWSLLLLALFYWIIDIRGWKKWAFFFTVIGMNPITIYILDRFFDFGIIVAIFVHGFIDYLGPYKPLVLELGTIAVTWSLLYYLYRQKFFLRV